MSYKLRQLVREILDEHLGKGCAVCDRDLPLDDQSLCRDCERMLVRVKMMNPEFTDEEAIAYGRSLRVNRKA